MIAFVTGSERRRAAAREASQSIGPEIHVSPREGGGFDSRYSIRPWRRIPRAVRSGCS